MDYCNEIVRMGTYESPAEYCENEAVPGEEKCIAHLMDDEDDARLDAHLEDLERE